jgi:hypothetical protein
MEALIALLNTPAAGAVAAIALSAIARGMPKPENGSYMLRWLYRTVQNVLANPDKASGAK